MNDRFLRVCRREPVDRTPVWFMRQAGRYQPEYRSLRERYSMLEICRNPELCVRTTMLPVEQLGVDAAILFADITLPLSGIGVPFEIVEGTGPVIETPVRTQTQIAALRRFEPEQEVPYVLEAIRLLRRELKVPLIGFAGAPFTVASYMIEGRGSRDLVLTKRMLYETPRLWTRLMEHLTDTTIAYLRAQVAAGAQAVQVFDSWVGALSPRDYARAVLPHMRRLFEATDALGVPSIHFGTGTGGLLGLMASAGGTVMGVDWRVRLSWAWSQIGEMAIQGNLDPILLLSRFDEVAEAASEIMEEARGRHGHIFNLGHGVLPKTPPDSLRRVVDLVHTFPRPESR